jgi:hypothetical protein
MLSLSKITLAATVENLAQPAAIQRAVVLLISPRLTISTITTTG